MELKEMKTVGHRLKYLLMRNMLTKKKFAEMTGMNYSQLHRILRGDGTPGFENLLRIKNTFPEVSLDYLIDGKGFLISPDDREWEMINTVREMDNNELPLIRAQLRMRWLEDNEISVLRESIAKEDDMTNVIKEQLYGKLYLKQIERRRISISRDQTRGDSRTEIIDNMIALMKGKEGTEDKQLNKITSSINNFCLLKSKEAKEILNQN